MDKPEKCDHFDLVYHFTVPFKKCFLPMITSFAQNNEIFIQFQVTLSQCSHLKS